MNEQDVINLAKLATDVVIEELLQYQPSSDFDEDKKPIWNESTLNKLTGILKAQVQQNTDGDSRRSIEFNKALQKAGILEGVDLTNITFTLDQVNEIALKVIAQIDNPLSYDNGSSVQDKKRDFIKAIEEVQRSDYSPTLFTKTTGATGFDGASSPAAQEGKRDVASEPIMPMPKPKEETGCCCW